MANTTTDSEISPAAQAAIRSAMTTLRPYAAEARVAALISKLGTIESSADGGTGRLAQLAKAMTDAEQIEKSGDAGPGLRERAGKAHRELEEQYLAVASPAGSAVRKRDRAALGVTA